MRAIAIPVTLSVAALLAACAPQAAPQPTAEPAGPDGPVTIVWENRPEGGLEDDPYVQAARAEDTGYLLAVNAQDFSIPEFTSTHTAADAQEFYDFFVDEYVDGGAPLVLFPGPSIWQPIEVIENASSDGADVVLCDASVDWAISAEFPEPAYDLEAGETLVITLITDPDTGALVFGGEDRVGDPCDATGAPIGRFDPQPQIPDALLTLDQVTAP